MIATIGTILVYFIIGVFGLFAVGCAIIGALILWNMPK